MKMKKLMAYLLTTVMVFSMMMGVPKGAAKVEAASDNLPNNLTITGGTPGTDYSYDSSTGKISVMTSKPLTLATTGVLSTAYFYVESGVSANLTLNKVMISNANGGIVIADDSAGTVTVTTASGTSNIIIGTSAPAITKNGTSGKLIFNGSGTLTANINGGLSCVGCATIGGADGKASGNIQIDSGTLVVNAATSSDGAGIGGGLGGEGNGITINGGTVTVTKNAGNGAGIGGGADGAGKNIVINGGTVKVTSVAGAAIGSGATLYSEPGVATGIVINGGTVTATGGYEYAPGIGTPNMGMTEYPDRYTDVTITGGTIVATGGERAPAIGSGFNTSANIYISGGSIKATSGGRNSSDTGTLPDAIGLGYAQNNSSKSYVSNIVYSKSDSTPVSLADTPAYDADTSLDGKLTFQLNGESYAYGTKDVVTDASGEVYFYLADGVTVTKNDSSSGGESGEEEVTDAVGLLYNGVTQKTYYNTDVVVTASTGHKIATSKDGEYKTSITFTSSANPTFYFRRSDGTPVSNTMQANIIIDKDAPTGYVLLNSTQYKTLATDTTATPYKFSNTTAMISGDDIDSGLKEVAYAVSDTRYTTADAITNANLSWTTTSASIIAYTVSSDKDEIIYGRFTDNAGNVAYVSTIKYRHDTIAPSLTASLTNETSESVDYALTFNEESEYWCVLCKNGETAPSNQAGYQSAVSTYSNRAISGKGTTVSGTFTGLDADTNYNLYVYARDLVGNLASSGSYASVTTSEGYVEVEEEVVLQFNGASLKTHYNENVVVTSTTGHKIATDKNGAYQSSVTLSAAGTYTLYFMNSNSQYLSNTETVTITFDKTAPTGKITLGGNTYQALAMNTTAARYKFDSTTATITGTDSNLTEIAYAVSSVRYNSATAIQNAYLNWKATTTSSITQSVNYTVTANTAEIIYARITDKAGNVTYVSTDMYYHDTVAPNVNATLSNSTDSTVDYSLSFGEQSDYWCVLLKSGESIPSSLSDFQTAMNTYGTRAKSGTASSVTGTFEGLEPYTTYNLYVYAKDTVGNVADVKSYANTITSKKNATMSDVTVAIQSGATSTTQYYYDFANALRNAGVEVSAMGSISYNVSAGSGSIVSGTPTVNNNVMTINVNSNLAEDISQVLNVTISSTYYNNITMKLTLETTTKKVVNLMGVVAKDATYTGSGQQGYTGTPYWIVPATGTNANIGTTNVRYEGVDVSYASTTAPTGAGTYKAIFEVPSTDSNYKGSGSVQFTINKADIDMSGVKWYLDGMEITDTNNAKVTYDGNSHKITVGSYSDMVWPSYSEEYEKTEVGNYTAKVSFTLNSNYTNNYNKPSDVILDWAIEKPEVVEEPKTTPNTDSVYWTYTQGASTNVYVENSTTLPANNTEYTIAVGGVPEGVTVTYGGTYKATNAGTYTATVTFGVTDATKYNTPTTTSKTLTWTIEQVAKTQLSLRGVTLQNGVYTGGNQTGYSGTPYWVDSSTGSTVNGLNTTVTYQGISLSYNSTTAPTNAGTYLAVFRAENDHYTGEGTVTFTIDKANIDMSGAKWYLDDTQIADTSNVRVLYDGAQHKVELKNYSYMVTPSLAGEYKKTATGNYVAEVNFTVNPSHADNYNTPAKMTLNWIIEEPVVEGTKITPDVSGTYWVYKQGDVVANYTEGSTKLAANGTAYSVELLGLPTGVTASYSGVRSATNAGTYTVTVTFGVTDSDKYELPNPSSKTLTWTIGNDTTTEKVTPNTYGTYWVYKQNGQVGNYYENSTQLVENGSVYTVAVQGLPQGVTATYSGTYSATKAGTYTATVTFGVTDSSKYNQPNPSSKTLTWTITSASGTVTNPGQGDDSGTVSKEVGATEVVSGAQYQVVTATTEGGTVSYTGPTNKKATKITVPSTITMSDGKAYAVTTIAKNAFKGCTKLKTVTIPNSVTSIGTGAFSGCKKLTTVKMGTGVKTIGDKAFYKCTSLKKITIPKNVTTIGKSCFEGCKSLKTITIKTKVLKKVGKKAIKGINKKATIKCPNKSYVKKYKKLFKSNTGYKKTMKIK
ncbi:MAG: leucine-rich repeat protein [Lachnospiraceae bacterium]|nr:leucine-rich repeat protein [Lachnospiraceae bacterium]